MKRARARGRSLTDYIQDILEREVSRPPADEVFEGVARRSPVKLGLPVAELIKQERADRDAS